MSAIVINERIYELWKKVREKQEWATVAFWHYVFEEVFFVGSDWHVCAEQPPTRNDDDKSRVDMRVDRWKPKWCTIMFFEAKKAKASPSEIETLEIQAYRACITYLNSTGREQIHAATAIGTSIRLWYMSLTGNAYILPFVPESMNIMDKASYIEAYSPEARLIVNGIQIIIQNDQGIMLGSSKPTTTPFSVPGPSNLAHPTDSQPSSATNNDSADPAVDSKDQE